MITAILVLGFFILFLFALGFFDIFNLKRAGAVLALVFICATAWIWVEMPVMHKQFSIDIVEYLVKINEDGSMSTTKQTTKTILHRNGNGEIRTRTRATRSMEE